MRLRGRGASEEEQGGPGSPPPGARLLVTVSTVKDSLGNVRRFVEGNLAAGADHMFVFLDGEQPEVRTWLESRPEVTVVTTDASYWGKRFPQNLNVRQIVNANLVNCLLAPFDWAGWLFHIDGDEVLDVDRARLLALGDDQRVVRLEPLEAVSRWHWEGEVDLFKRPLDKGALYLLHQLGVIAEPENRAYYRGHVIGKTGIRPDVALDMRVHDAWSSDAEPVEFLRDTWLRLRHYETYSGEEFMRKWSTGPATVPKVKTRARREQQTAAVRALFALPGLDATEREAVARRLYERSFQDDVETLLALGLLVRHAAADDRHVPTPLTDDQRAPMERWLAALTTLDKRHLRPLDKKFAKVAGLGRLAERLAAEDPELAQQVRACLPRPAEPATQA